MKCGDPWLCYIDGKGNRKFKKFSWYVGPRRLFLPRDHIPFKCGQCLDCRKKSSRQLAVRCVLHASLTPGNNCFLTLTYNEKKKGYHNDFEYPDIQKFKKRLRSFIWRTYKKKIDIYNVHEYGKNGKKHWHLLVFGHDWPDKEVHTYKNDRPLYTSMELRSLWRHGFSTSGDVEFGSAMYQSQYMEKDIKNRTQGTSKRSHSKHSGIGFPYFDRNFRQILRLGYIPFDGHKIPIPRSFIRRAHRHYCHFYDVAAFRDTQTRKAIYRPFKNGEENQEIADLYVLFKSIRDATLLKVQEEWDQVVDQFLTTGRDPDFITSNNNALYDLRNTSAQEKF